jgi:hypothetical protein
VLGIFSFSSARRVVISQEKKIHFPFHVGCSENRNRRRSRAQPALIHTEEGEKMGNRKFLSLAFYFMAASIKDI